MSNLSELSNKDANAILRHLISMFKKYDLSDVHEIVSSKLKQDMIAFEDKEIDMVEYLKRYVYTSIKVLQGRSSEHYDEVIDKLNKYIQCENYQPIRGVKLHLSPAETELAGREEIDLIKLPDYSIIIYGLKEILGESNWRGNYE